jgi:hypothetical protein
METTALYTGRAVELGWGYSSYYMSYNRTVASDGHGRWHNYHPGLADQPSSLIFDAFSYYTRKSSYDSESDGVGSADEVRCLPSPKITAELGPARKITHITHT